MNARLNNGSADYLTREKVRANLGTSLYVEAGAGTGKTEILVTRLSELLLSHDAQPNEIAAITFTRAAAFEMRSRIRTNLERRLAEAGTSEAHSQILTVLDGLDSLSIQTIHAFALSILREHPLEAGLPPIVEPVDDVLASIEFDDRWDGWFGERAEFDVDLLKALSNAQQLGLRAPADRLRELALRLDDHHHLLKPGEFINDGPEPRPMPVSFITETLAEIRSLAAVCPVAEDAMRVWVYESVVPTLESLIALAANDSELPAEDFADFPPLKVGRKGAKKNWAQVAGGENALDALREKLTEFQDRIDASLEVLRRKTAMKLFDAISSFVLEYSERRRIEGRLTFHDQLVLAKHLLESNHKVRQRVQGQYRYLLVDEFQDTDPIQLALLRLLSSDNRGEFLPGRIFIVGDPKQSIYRFRGADPVSARLFSSDVAHTGHQLSLAENHRSVPGILRWVNSVFSGWMKEGEGYGQAPYSDLAWEPDLETPADDPVPVQWFGGEREVNAAETRLLEFNEIAAIAELVGAGGFTVRERDGSVRQSRFSDLAVLLRSRTGLDALEDALTQQNVPYVFDGQAPLFTSQDIRDLHSCLVAIDDPSDEVAVLAAVRSPAFSCSDVDLLEWSRYGGGFNYLAEIGTQKSGQVAKAFTALRRFHHLSRETSMAVLVEKFVRDRKLREKAMLTHRGLDRVRRLDLLVELAGSLEESGGQTGTLTLRNFTRWLSQQSDENARIPDHVSSAIQGEAVRIMTVHSAKGLEFPIVVMASPPSGGNQRDSIRIVSHQHEGKEQIEVQLGGKDLGLRTDRAEQALEEDSLQSDLEDVRLMYVAATRARDHLLVSRYRPKRTKSSIPAEIERHLEGSESLWREWLRPTDVKRRYSQEPISADTVEERDAWIENRAKLVAAASRSRYTTPTAIKSGKGQPVDDEKLAAEPTEDEPSLPGRAATNLGRAVHAVLQHVDLAEWDDEQVRSVAVRMCDDHGIPDSVSEVTALATAALETPIMQRASASAQRGEAWREVSVAAELGDVDGELEGQIDLLFVEDDDSVTIVDHKTDRERGNSIEESAAPYLLQMGAYAWCVEQVSRKKVTRAVLVFSRRARSGEIGEYEVPDLATHMREAARLAAEQVSSTTVSG